MSKRNDRREAERLARRAAYLQSRTQTAAAEQATEVNEGTELIADTAEPHSTEAFPTASPTIPSATTETQSDELILQNRSPLESFGAEQNAFYATPSGKEMLAYGEANARNAQLSTGPKTEAGKAISSQNALKHGLTGKTVLLPTDNAVEYEKLLNLYIERHAPVGDEEEALVQSLLDCKWRIARIKNLETGIMLKGQIEFAKVHEYRPAHQRMQLIQVETYLKYEKSLRNLNIQEARLYRRLEKDQAELTRLQSVRKRQAADDARQAKPVTQPTTAPPNGFVFSSAPIHSKNSAKISNKSPLMTCEAIAS